MPSSGVLPAERGGVPGSGWRRSQARHRPSPARPSQSRSRPTAAALNCAWKSPNEPNLAATASPSAPLGSPPLPGPSTVPEERVVVMAAGGYCEPAPCLSAGSCARLVRISSTPLSAHSVPASAAFALLTYAAWCFVVMDLHRLRVDVRLECVEGIGQRGYGKGHDSPIAWGCLSIYRYPVARAEPTLGWGQTVGNPRWWALRMVGGAGRWLRAVRAGELRFEVHGHGARVSGGAACAAVNRPTATLGRP